MECVPLLPFPPEGRPGFADSRPKTTAIPVSNKTRAMQSAQSGERHVRYGSFDRQGFKPHTKSMPLDKLAPHVAELAGFGATILTTPELDFGKAPQHARPPFESAGLLKVFDENVAKARTALTGLPDEAWIQ